MVRLVYLTPNSTDIIAYASRFSTATQEVDLNEQITKGEMNEKLVKKLLDRGHMSCLEFADAMFELECSLNCSHQIVRHRHFSYCQKSLRYTVSDGEFIMPKEVEDRYSIGALKQIYGNMQGLYRTMVDAGIKKEDARFFLPTGTKTKLVMKGNFRSWIEFFKLRCDNHAQWEIRQLAEEMREILKKETFVFQYLYGGNKCI